LNEGPNTLNKPHMAFGISRLLSLVRFFPFALLCCGAAQGPDKAGDLPGDAMIQEYLRQETRKIETEFLGQIKSPEDWQRALPQFRQEYFDMLGLWPLPEKTPLPATITGTLDRGDYLVDMIHYQSRPGLYVTGNLYRPAKVTKAERLPAILYVCGHSQRGRNGNKTAYQSHGIWFARHGYACLTVDTLQLGEIAGIHHGTYRESRWWWLSRGYTPAGVECWNGIRGIDYLLSRDDVDSQRIGVTGISGGGAATFWITAADERVKVAVPVSGLSDLSSYVSYHIVDGHCDCMFLYNTYQWPWARIPALIAPRPLLFVNSDQDSIFPMDGNERVINRLERVYSFFGAGDLVDSVVSIGGHAYRADIRRAAYRFLNTHLKIDPRPVLDSEIDLVTGPSETIHPIPPEQLRVFPHDSDIPLDARNTRIDQEFVPMAKMEPPKTGEFDTWKSANLHELRRISFHHFPDRVPSAQAVETNSAGTIRLETEPPITVSLRPLQAPGDHPGRIWVLAANESPQEWTWLKKISSEQDGVYICEPRGIGDSRWTRKNPPNYVERSHYLLGRTVDSGRVWDLAAVVRFVKSLYRDRTPVYLAGEGAGGVLSAYAALLEPDVSGVVMVHPPASHMEDSAPALLNVLRVCDIPEVVGMLAPRPVTVVGAAGSWIQTPAQIYSSAGAAEKYSVAP
jgi:cephalosporin-C deacetylase-like acetyl esterase